MKDEPDIVKELRQEEQCGRLHSSFFRHKNEDIDYSVLPYDNRSRQEESEGESHQGNLIQVSVEH